MMIPEVVPIGDRELSDEGRQAKDIEYQHSFMVFDSNGLKFASQKLYDDFECNNLDEIKSKVCTKFNLAGFLKEDSTSQEKFALITSSTSKFNSDKFIYINKEVKSNCEDSSGMSFIKNRIYFIEILKERVLEKSITNTQLGIITIQIENMSNLKNDWSEYEIEMAIRDLLLQVAIKIDSSTLLGQHNNDLYLVLLENISFDDLKEKSYNIQTHITSYNSKQEIRPLLGLYAFDINDLELNSVLKTINNISRNSISLKDIETQNLHRVTHKNEDLDDLKAIDIFLQETFTNKTHIKLLNIYKGLCINTSSKIVKKTAEEIYVTFEQLQGTAIHFENETVLQSSNFPKDIVADVKYIDHKKKLVQLKNFRFVQGNANSRKYSRVTFSQRTPISITHDNGTMNGEIVDLSINSIAIKSRIYKNMDSLKLSKIVLSFTLPIKSSEEGYVKLALNAKVIFVLCDDKFCKIVINLFDNEASESILMEYVYNRQKEIIVELKKQTTVLS